MNCSNLRRRLAFVGLVAVAGLAWTPTPPAFAGVITSETPLATYGFTNLSANDPADAVTGESQLFVDVFGWDGSSATTSLSETSVLFRFRNEGPSASSIARVYFEDGRLLTMSELIDADHASFDLSGVYFSEYAKPAKVPAWQNASFDGQFSADADAPSPYRGVNPGEELGVSFALQSSLNTNDIINSLDTKNGHIGIHVTAFDGGGSESFLNGPNLSQAPVVPEPASLLVWGLGVIVGGGSLHRRKRRLAATA